MQVLSGPHQSDGSGFHDICDGLLFQTHPVCSENPNALQILAYYDEFTAVNQLSSVSKQYKIGMLLYMQIYITYI